eukprot:COSAG01_NODE_5675_length_4107_cov_2.978293_5_plen_283_part_00
MKAFLRPSISAHRASAMARTCARRSILVIRAAPSHHSVATATPIKPADLLPNPSTVRCPSRLARPAANIAQAAGLWSLFYGRLRHARTSASRHRCPCCLLILLSTSSSASPGVRPPPPGWSASAPSDGGTRPPPKPAASPAWGGGAAGPLPHSRTPVDSSRRHRPARDFRRCARHLPATLLAAVARQRRWPWGAATRLGGDELISAAGPAAAPPPPALAAARGWEKEVVAPVVAFRSTLKLAPCRASQVASTAAAPADTPAQNTPPICVNGMMCRLLHSQRP